MKKSHLAIGLAAIVIMAIFAVDYWLRANKKFVGGEVVDPVAPSAPAKPETFETMYERAMATESSVARAQMLMNIETTTAAKNDPADFGK